MVPPLGLMYLASTLMQAGHRVRIIRWQDAADSTRNLENVVADFSPAVVGISAIVPEIGALRAVMPNIQRLLPGVPVMVGGHLASANPMRTLQIPGVTVIALREGERTIIDLVDAFTQGRAPDGIPGTGVLRDGRIAITRFEEQVLR